MRSPGDTKSGEPALVTLLTKVTMAFFDAPSFQEGSGSRCACAIVGTMPTRIVATAVNTMLINMCLDGFIAFSFFVLSAPLLVQLVMPNCLTPEHWKQ